MPNSEEILAGLTAIARNALPLAVLWHVALAATLLALALGVRPSRRWAAAALALPLGSVSALAWWHGNPFNAAVLGVGSLALLGLALRLPAVPTERASTTLTVWALLLIEFGWIYPHFSSDHLSLVYLYAAPLGLIPCPTLSVVIGFAILARGFEARAWSSLLGALGLFYGMFGVARLGIAIDALLTIGALILLGLVWSQGRAGSGATHAARA